mmetsp:Transcript_27923/g.47469  ORF Transcript_27923/g.47469 Transcript_27923/m.47469 type:complete len:100 (-) Transcript_27923:827-1126(-)
MNGLHVVQMEMQCANNGILGMCTCMIRHCRMHKTNLLRDNVSCVPDSIFHQCRSSSSPSGGVHITFPERAHTAFSKYFVGNIPFFSSTPDVKITPLSLR